MGTWVSVSREEFDVLSPTLRYYLTLKLINLLTFLKRRAGKSLRFSYATKRGWIIASYGNPAPFVV